MIDIHSETAEIRRGKNKHKMLDLNKHRKTKRKPTLIFEKCWYVCVYHCAQLSYTSDSTEQFWWFSLLSSTQSSDDCRRGGEV